MFSRKYENHRRIGFTLIELLVVVAIIALLAMILFPVFARARENARRSACTSNLKQIDLSVQMYAQDYDEHFPPYWNGRSSSNDAWMTLIVPYVKNTEVYFCPSSKLTHNSGALPDYYNSTYGLNFYYLTKTVSITVAGNNYPGGNYCMVDGCTGISLAAVNSPSETIMLGDRDDPAGGSYVIESYNYPITAQHFDGANVAFVDGHVKWMKVPGLLQNNHTLWDLN